MHLHNCWCFQEHLWMLLQSLRALYFAPGGPGSSWMYVKALVRPNGVSGRFACRFLTNLHFADVSHSMIHKLTSCLKHAKITQLTYRNTVLKKLLSILLYCLSSKLPELKCTWLVDIQLQKIDNLLLVKWLLMSPGEFAYLQRIIPTTMKIMMRKMTLLIWTTVLEMARDVTCI